MLGILTFDALGPTAPRVASLVALGLEVQPTRRLPLAFVSGTQSAIDTAIRLGVASRFHPDEPLVVASAAANTALGADGLHGFGLDGEGLTVAIVDTGVDATHPDLAGRVRHNVEIVGPENAQLPHDGPPGNHVVPLDRGPYSNTDVGDGHGTMVAGIIAGDGTTDPRLLGVAPAAELVGYGAGPALWVRTVVAAYDHILDHPDWGIDVVNNSFGGTTWQPFDPSHPIHVATAALTDAGISVVFAAGNSGTDESPMTLNTLSAAPWVVSVGASTLHAERALFSSNGLVEDNSEAVGLVDGHARFDGERIGLYHPTVMAPGTDIETTCTSTGVLYSGVCTEEGTITTEGTSLAAPQVSGLLALLEQARPDLRPAEAKRLLEATATPTDPVTPFWQSGYGVVDGAAALTLLRHPNFRQRLAKAHAKATERVGSEAPWVVQASDHWSWDIPPATLAGVPDTRDLSVVVPAGTEALRVVIASGTNVSYWVAEESYEITVLDADQEVVGRTEKRLAFLSEVLLDLRGRDLAFGAWTMHVTGKLAASEDPRSPWSVTVVSAQLRRGSAA